MPFESSSSELQLTMNFELSYLRLPGAHTVLRQTLVSALVPLAHLLDSEVPAVHQLDPAKYPFGKVSVFDRSVKH